MPSETETDFGYRPCLQTEGGVIPTPSAPDKNGAEVRPGDRVLARFLVRDIMTRDLVLNTEEPVDPSVDDPAFRRRTVCWLKPHQVELVREAEPVRGGIDVEELVGLCRELLDSAGQTLAGRTTVASTPLQWLKAMLAKPARGA